MFPALLGFHNARSRRGQREHWHTNDDDDGDDDEDDYDDHSEDEDVDGRAFCTCAVFVGRTLFLGEGMTEDGACFSFALFMVLCCAQYTSRAFPGSIAPVAKRRLLHLSFVVFGLLLPGYDTGFIYAHRSYDGRQLYR